MHSPAVRDKRPSSSEPRDRIPVRRETSQTQYTLSGVPGGAAGKGVLGTYVSETEPAAVLRVSAEGTSRE
jgi:hypothetical protein